jgi:hypothetical protein
MSVVKKKAIEKPKSPVGKQKNLEQKEPSLVK